MAALLILFTDSFTVGSFVFYSYCGITDIADGIIARKTYTQSSFGEKLDSMQILYLLQSVYIKFCRR
ncbi:CDP-alcohol phosphatidyltransferase family protein [Syntrophomonas wolfei]|uniref:CDP-alcohol phosphatidyltransferase family protein n=1 Tax=Syntrophomonas wolfei TaxID=863 RepID=UPI0039C9CA27